jgi:N-formylglutamate deformylase
MSRRKTILLSIPHGGLEMPAELAPMAAIPAEDVFADIDPFTREIFTLDLETVAVVDTGIARTFVDMNRAVDDLPPANPDGVVKTETCHGKRIYARPLNGRVIAGLLESHYHPYHERIRAAIERFRPHIALDCHSMAAVGPKISPDVGLERPMVCLGNRHGQACVDEIVQRLGRCFLQAFDLRPEQLTINRPFAGGFITRHFGNNPVPWVQVEISRALYLDPRWFDADSLEIDRERLAELNGMFRTAVTLFLDDSD